MAGTVESRQLLGTPIRTAEQADRFLESLIKQAPRSYSSRAPFAQQAVRRLLHHIGDPHHGLRIVHIAGSKGKGSTALLIEAILQAAGRRTGTYTSPHLQRWTERFRIDGRDIQGERLAAALERLRPAVERLHAEQPAHSPSFFDVATAAALLLFREAAVDVAVLETGLGGRLDATNIVQPAVSCITTIELEHTHELGGTLAAIAREKAGIIKPATPVVIGKLPASAAAEVMERARSVNAAPIRWGRELRLKTVARNATTQTLCIHIGDIRTTAVLPMAGRHMAHNAALALACVQRLDILDPAELAQAAERGFAGARLPGRSEILCHSPWVVVDAAHTPASARALAATLATLHANPRHLVISVSMGKNLQPLLDPLLSLIQMVTVTRADPTRSLPPETVAAAIRALSPSAVIRIVADPVQAVQSAYRMLAPSALLCVTGSVYMAGRARTALEKLTNR